MNLWWARLAFVAGTTAMAVVRAPHIRRSISLPVTAARKGRRERALLGFVTVGLITQVTWCVAPSVFAAASVEGAPVPFTAGVATLVLGLWLLHRSHVDLGRNWSNTLEVRAGHAVVSHGVYARIRHPMYVALLLYSAGQAFFIPNWIAGPAFLVPFALLVALRIGPEERMMLAELGAPYAAYQARTQRLIPGVW